MNSPTLATDRPLRLFLTGASGYLGRHLLAAAPATWQIHACFHAHPVRPAAHIVPLPLDVTDARAVHRAVQAANPDVVVHTAIARQPEWFDAVIVHGSRNVAGAASVSGARLIHLSSDIVFDGELGEGERYDETASPCPEPAPGSPDLLNSHGRAKARAEQAVRDQHPAPVIVRTSLIYGFDPLDHSTTWLANGLRHGQPVTLFTDQIRCPIYAPDLAACLIELALHTFTGVINLAGPTALSRYEFGLFLCQALGLDPTGLIAAPTPPDFQAPRRLVLDDTLARSLLVAPRRPPILTR